MLEEIYGAGSSLTFYLLGGLFANCVKLAVHAGGLAPAIPSIGASGP